MASDTLPTEVTEHHSRLLKFTLGVEETRDYLGRRGLSKERPSPTDAFEERWFGARSEQRVKIIMRNMKARFDAFPRALGVLVTWEDMDPSVRTIICHWHTQLSDPTYRAFTGEYLPGRFLTLSQDTTLERTTDWVSANYPSDWQPATVRQMASKLLSASNQAGLVDGTRGKRRVTLPRVPDEALSYLMYLLRGMVFEGTLLENPYLRSVGLEGVLVEDRLRSLEDVTLHRQGDLLDFNWTQPSLEAWGASRS